MKAGLSIVVTIRGDEPKAADTMINAKRQAGCPVELIAVYDGTEPDPDLPVNQILAHRTARGIGPSRHKGVMAAQYSVVLLIDAHMNFQKDFGKTILKHYKNKAHARDVTCGRCVPSMLDLSPMKHEDGTIEYGYTGARFSLRSEESGGEKWCLSGKWADQKVNTEIGCVFGATYAFRKTWYKKIGEPLDLLRGWYGDEEYLSIASWLAGGRCVLLDYWASHLFRDTPSFNWTRSDMMYPSVNRARMVDLFPAGPELKEDLRAWLELSFRSSDADFQRAYNADRARPEVLKAKILWKKWADRVPEFMERWVDSEAEDLAAREAKRAEARPWKTDAPQKSNRTPVKPVPSLDVAQTVPRVQRRAYIICKNCGRRNTFRVDRTVRQAGGTVRYGVCNNINCQTRGVMIDRVDSQVMYWGREADLL